MLINEIAKKIELSPKTIRFYEKVKIIPEPKRNSSNYRIYDEKDLSRLAFVKKARKLDLSINDIKTILEIREEGKLPANKVIELLKEKKKEVEEKIAMLTKFQTELDETIDNFESNPEICEKGKYCGLIEVLFDN